METNEDILTEESLTHIISVLEEKGVEHWFTGPVSDFIPPSLLGSGRSFVKGADTVDVWFDSGTAWSLVRDSHGARVDKEGAKYFADVVVEGSDQHRGWFQSLLLTSISATKDSTGQPTSPYKSLLTHGFVLDQDGKKMSKSLGNVISPITIIEGGKVQSMLTPPRNILTLIFRTKRRSQHMGPMCFVCGLLLSSTERMWHLDQQY